MCKKIIYLKVEDQQTIPVVIPAVAGLSLIEALVTELVAVVIAADSGFIIGYKLPKTDNKKCCYIMIKAIWNKDIPLPCFLKLPSEHLKNEFRMCTASVIHQH